MHYPYNSPILIHQSNPSPHPKPPAAGSAAPACECSQWEIFIYIHDHVAGFDSHSINTSDRLQGKYAREQVYYICNIACRAT